VGHKRSAAISKYVGKRSGLVPKKSNLCLFWLTSLRPEPNAIDSSGAQLRAVPGRAALRQRTDNLLTLRLRPVYRLREGGYYRHQMEDEDILLQARCGILAGTLGLFL
jgi:hypothetical protein